MSSTATADAVMPEMLHVTVVLAPRLSVVVRATSVRGCGAMGFGGRLGGEAALLRVIARGIRAARLGRGEGGLRGLQLLVGLGQGLGGGKGHDPGEDGAPGRPQFGHVAHPLLIPA